MSGNSRRHQAADEHIDFGAGVMVEGRRHIRGAQVLLHFSRLAPAPSSFGGPLRLPATATRKRKMAHWLPSVFSFFF